MQIVRVQKPAVQAADVTQALPADWWGPRTVAPAKSTKAIVAQRQVAVGTVPNTVPS